MSSYSLIYEPRGRAREYAPLACNVYRGCDHQCSYCYAASATQRSRSDFNIPATRGADFITRLTREAFKRQSRGQAGRVLLCFTCDPYQRLDAELGLTRQAIQVLHNTGHAVEVLTKGGSRALRDIDLLGPGDAFASTLTLLDAESSLEWEPGAATPADRIETIRAFHSAGVPTWGSLEPVLDPGIALEIIRQTHEFVDLFKVGRLNYHPLARQIDWAKFGCDAIALLRSVGSQYYIKRDLACLLPPNLVTDTRTAEPEPVQRPAVQQMSLL